MASSVNDPDRYVPNRGPAVFAVTTATLILASVFVGARFICRCFIVRRITWDDRIMLLAWLIAFFLSFTILLGVVNGLGKYDQDIPDDDWVTLRRCEYIFSILYNPALMATKTSILIFYLRLAKNTQLVLRYASWATLVVVNVAGLVLTFMNIFQCNPIQAAWAAYHYETPSCIPLLTEFICSSPVNVVTDLAILALPIPVLTGMRLPLRQKTILILTFTLGIFVTIVDVVRIYYLQSAITDVPTGGTSTNPNATFGGQADFAWNASISLMWSAVEVNVGMTCACVPTLKPLILKLMPAMLFDQHGPKPADESETHSSQQQQQQHRDAPATALPAVACPQQAHLANDPEPPLSFGEFLAMPGTVSPGTNVSEDNNESAVSNNSNDSNDSHENDNNDDDDDDYDWLPEDPDPITQTRTNRTHSTACTVESGVYFGFVNMTKPKSMLRANASESFKYCTIVSILFLLWGMSYGLLNMLNNAVAFVNNMSPAQALGLTTAYFGGGYFFGPLLVGEWILRRDEHNRTKRHEKNEAEHVGGFKVTFIVGLCIYGIGTIIFWPSAVTNSYGGFMLSNFVVGFGLSVLEVGANAFMVLCGPPAFGETRLLLAQGIQGIGSVVSGLLAQKVFFKGIADSITDGDTADSMTLINVQWAYLGITLLCVALALFFFYMPLPEVSDSELDALAKRLPIEPKKRSIGGLQLRTVSLILAVFSQYIYVASQESNGIYFGPLLVSITRSDDGSGHDGLGGSDSLELDRPPGIAIAISDYMLVGHTALTLSRFLVGYLTYLSVRYPHRLPQPRTYLTISVGLCLVISIVPVVLHTTDPNIMVIPLLLFFFAEGPIWPLIFAIGLRGQGLRTKRAAAFITMGGAGAGFFPFIMYGIIKNGGSVQMAFILIIALQAAMAVYPLFLELSGDARRLVDPCRNVRVPRRLEERPVDEQVAEWRRRNEAREKRSLRHKVTRSLGARFSGMRKPSIPQGESEHFESVSSSP
ncbi:L-fucose permease [Drechmeria coniospora]|uniref:L-fucose permease n=1 Tax=Drechmeria coniospora TaxID=98403 RepID=A0A151GLT0_DRECN|nr:L-fucose permease [Drechmeria coniospora]KYK58060.1 L-fucose permease [Drechmeria coniospora]